MLWLRWQSGHELFHILGELRNIAASIRIPVNSDKLNEINTDAADGENTTNADPATSRGLTMVELSLAWCLAQQGVTSILMGARNADQVWILPPI